VPSSPNIASLPSPSPSELPSPLPAASEQHPSKPLPLLRSLATLSAITAALALLFAHLWPSDLADVGRRTVLLYWAAFLVLTFQFQIGVALIPIAVFAAAMRMRRTLLLLAILLTATLGPALWSLRPRAAAVPAPGEDSLLVMSANLMISNPTPAALLAQIARESPDILVFQEYGPEAAAKLAPALQASYPYRIEVPRDDAFGQAIFSNRPFRGQPRLYPPVADWGDPQIKVTVELGGRPLPIIDAHLWPPGSRAMVQGQRHQARELADIAAAEIAASGSLLLCGDLNATPESPHVAALRRAGLRESNTLAGSGRGTTWPRISFLSYFPGIRLDHVLLSDDLLCARAWTGEDYGSDHRPVFARIVRAPGRQSAPAARH
jgi:endonuclease/exonuclease/phosphatase (EEP) superfamily protein YafD